MLARVLDLEPACALNARLGTLVVRRREVPLESLAGRHANHYPDERADRAANDATNEPADMVIGVAAGELLDRRFPSTGDGAAPSKA